MTLALSLRAVELAPSPAPAPSSDYERIARAIRHLGDHASLQPSLEEVAAAIGLSPFHTQRLFTRWAGISPKRFLGLLTVGHAKRLLRERASVLDAAYEVGLSGPSRLHDLFVTYEAMTPGQYKEEGRDLVLVHGVHDTPFGRAFALASERGIARLAFLEDEAEAVAELEAARAAWPLSRLVANQGRSGEWVRRCFDPGAKGPPPLLLKGTNFQIRVWSALLQIPAGTVTTYKGIARALGQEQAARAVGRAVGANRIGYLIPCHRIIRETGALAGYHWGTTRKQAILAWEAAHAEAAAL